MGRAALRIGDWKMIWIERPHGAGDWQLYDLSTDLAEQYDLAKKKPEKLTELKVAWDNYVKDTGGNT